MLSRIYSKLILFFILKSSYMYVQAKGNWIVNNKEKEDGALVFNNYFVCFLDLLGQRAALTGQDLIPIDPDALLKFKDSVRLAIGGILALQNQALEMQRGLTESTESELLLNLSPQEKDYVKQIREVKIHCQRWSDGLMHFSKISDEETKCPVNALWSLLGIAGSMCFIGLGIKNPIRGAIDIGWAVELHDKELYGAAVANAYILESEQAQYPRIVVGTHVYNYLRHIIDIEHTNVYEKYSSVMASKCLSMLREDSDGLLIVDYLGEEFKDAISATEHNDMYNDALSFIHDQLELHRRMADSKLEERYLRLLSYFEANKPKT
jgi:hypothetical protein